MNDQNISMAQAVITCELCQDESVLMHCNSCKIKLCNDCVGKHVTSQLSKQHDVVGFKYRKVTSTFHNVLTIYIKSVISIAKTVIVLFVASVWLLLNTNNTK